MSHDTPPPSFEALAERTLLEAVHARRQARRRRTAAAAGLAVSLGGLALVLLRPPSPSPEAPAVPATVHRTVASRPGVHTVVRSASPRLLIVHTGEVRPARIDDQTLFALLPEATMRIAPDGTQELRWEP